MPFTPQALAIVPDDEYDPERMTLQEQQRKTMTALADDEDDGDDILLIAATTLPDVQHLQPEEVRGPHQHPQDQRGQHRKPQDQRGQHRKPGEIRAPHTQPPGREGAHKQPGKMSEVVMGGMVLVLIAGLLITLLTQLPGDRKTETPTAPPNITRQSSALSVLHAGNAFPGGSITLHGEHFLPGGTVTFSTQKAGLARTTNPTSLPEQLRTAPLALYAAERTASIVAEIPPATVKADRTFDATFTLPNDWQPGYHYNILATEQQNGQTATATVTVTVQKPQASPTAGPTPTPTATPTAIVPPTATTAPPVQRQLTANGTATGSATATGTRTIPGTSAQGTLHFPYARITINFPAGTQFVSDNGNYNSVDTHVTMVLDQAVTVNSQRSTTGAAHVFTPGASGNIPAYSNSNGVIHGFTSNYCTTMPSGASYCILITSATNFTGGTDPQSYVAVAQGDIDAASNQAQTAATNAAVQDLQNQLQVNEHFVDNPQCTATETTPDHQVGDRAQTVNVTMAVSCTVIAST